MIGQATWFQRRKYGGWGLSPRTWQGWAYIAVIAVVSFGLLNAPFVPESVRFPLTYAWIALMCVDLIHILVTLKKDEMETKIEAFAERNAAWTMIAVLAAGVAFQAARSMVTGKPEIDWFIIAALAGGTIAKAVTNFILERKGI